MPSQQPTGPARAGTRPVKHPVTARTIFPELNVWRMDRYPIRAYFFLRCFLAFLRFSLILARSAADRPTDGAGMPPPGSPPGMRAPWGMDGIFPPAIFFIIFCICSKFLSS